MTDVATCPDCLRPKADDARPTTPGCKQGLLTALGEPYRSRCFELAVDRLRSDLANLQAKYDTLAAAHAKPSPELTAVEAHNAEAVRLLRVLGGVVFTRHMGGESNVVAVAKWLDNDALLLAERAKAGR